MPVLARHVGLVDESILHVPMRAFGGRAIKENRDAAAEPWRNNGNPAARRYAGARPWFRASHRLHAHARAPYAKCSRDRLFWRPRQWPAAKASVSAYVPRRTSGPTP